ncbi:hypothetical protein F9054_25575 [Escherichia coli]|nr:hypothetical protein F9054_25575 [Escherichia coli]
MLPSETMIWQPEFTDKTLSRKPEAVQTFNNYLKSQMRGEWRDVLTRGIRDELVRRGVMKIQGNKIIW